MVTSVCRKNDKRARNALPPVAIMILHRILQDDAKREEETHQLSSDGFPREQKQSKEKLSAR